MIPARLSTTAGPVLLAAPVLALTALLPWRTAWICALACIIVLGVPHGALDGELARSRWRASLGRAWFLVFSVPYLSLAALVLLAWHVAPLTTLALFLAASVWHFGSEDSASGDPVEAIVRGGIPIAVPVLAHPAATAFILGSVAQTTLLRPPVWLDSAALGWLALLGGWGSLAVMKLRARSLATPALVVALFVLLPPLTALAIYFVCVHAPAHTAALIRDRVRAPRIRDMPSAWRLALPVTLLTVLIGALLWPLYPGEPAVRLLSLTIQSLAALTLPHMLLDRLRARDRLGNDLGAARQPLQPVA